MHDRHDHDVGEYEWERDGEVLACPWHGWEFDVTTGESVFNPHRWRVATSETDVIEGDARLADADREDPSVDTHPVEVEDGIVVVYV